MRYLVILKVAFRALRRNKLRTALTMLGIIIGVGAVIAMVSIGQGANAMVQDQIESIGTNIMYVWAGSHMAPGAVRQGAGTAASLTAEDVTAIEREVPTVASATPVVRANAQLIYSNQNWGTNIQGTNEKFCQIRRWSLAEGEFFTESDVRSAARVAVVGQTVVENLFQGVNPLGQTVRVRNLPFRVIGVLSAKGQSMMGQDQDDLVVTPYTTVQKKLLGQTILSIGSVMISCVSPKASRLTEIQITDLLRQRHRIQAGAEDDFRVRNMSDVAETAQQTNQVMTLLLGSIAAVSLLVGGIGIMNIMLVSVTERTREIGIRMAIGARPGHIRLQFLTESVVLSLLGGAFGILLGAGLSIAIAKLLTWPTLLSPLSMMVSFGFSAAVGMFFGYYPAHKAASLDPIEALRYE
jgi:putative ABC transport system permease protein